LPDSFGGLRSLKDITLRALDIEKLPATIGNLAALESLNLSSSDISTLPESFGKLKKLKKLEAEGITILPDSIIHCDALGAIKIPYGKLTRIVWRFAGFLEKHSFFLEIKKRMYMYMFRRLDRLQKKLDVCGWHEKRGIHVCRKNHNRCCGGRNTCGYLGADGCQTECLSCKMWFCDSALEYLHRVKADPKHPLHRLCVKYLRMRIKYDAWCFALRIPLKLWASQFDTFCNQNAKKRINTYIDRWYDNIRLYSWGDFVSAEEIAIMRMTPYC
jgi:hypothetical protein